MAPASSANQLIASVYAAFKKGDIPFILNQVAPNAPWIQPDTLPWGGTRRGPEGAAEFFQTLNEYVETAAFDVHQNIEVGDEVFSFGAYTARGRKTGKTALAEWMFRWQVQDGKITSWTSYIDTAALAAIL